MPVFIFTLKKYLKSKSTWIIMVISVLLFSFLAGGILFRSFVKDDMSAPAYAGVVKTIVSIVTSSMAIFSAIFAGFKAAGMYKDEVEEGTFLMMISKPVRRSRIIFEKWLSLALIITIYAFTNAAFYALFAFLFDKGDKVVALQSGAANGIEPLKNNVLMVALFIFAILLVTGMIFASLGIFISTKLSVSATVGISIGLGIIIPISGLILNITKKDEYKTFVNPQYSILKGMLGPEANDLNKAIESADIYNYAGATGEKDLMKYLWFLNLSYQNSSMASKASDQTLSATGNELANALSGQNTFEKFDEKSTQKIDQVLTSLQNVMTKFDEKFQGPIQIGVAPDGTAIMLNNMSPRDMGVFNLSVALNETLATLGTTPISVNISTLKSLIDGTNPAKTDLPALQTLINNQTLGTQKVDPVELMAAIAELATVDFKDIASVDNGGNKGNAVKMASFFVSQLEDNILKDVEDDLSDNQAAQVKLFADNIGKFVSPLSSLLLQGDVVKSFAQGTSKAAYNVWFTDPANQAKVTGLELSNDDSKTLENLLRAAGDDKLKTVEGKQYMKSDYILVIYAAIALALVPLTFLVMRRQDFR